MRISVRKDDSSYNPENPYCGELIVTVDGVDVTRRCHTADEELRTAWCYALNAEGEKYVDLNDPSPYAVQEILQGVVVITQKQIKS